MKSAFCKWMIVGFGLAPMMLIGQELKDVGGGNLNPERLDLGDAKDEGVSLTRKGELLPGDAGSAITGLTPEEAEEKKENLKLPDSVMKLLPEQREEIQKLMSEAATFIQGIRLQEGLDRLIQIEAITPDLYQTYNLRGAIYTKLRDFDKARGAFQKALELQPNLMEAMFNLAELDFVERKFAAAEAAFEHLKNNFSNLKLETLKLIDYKLFISKLLQSNSSGDAKEKEAETMLAGFDYMDDAPVYYYSQAALAFHRENKEEAQGWMNSAQRIYDKATQTIYIDALIEMGWVDSL